MRTYNEIKTAIKEEFNVTIYDSTLKVVILRSVLGYKWEYGKESGDLPYLCDSDFKKLKDDVYDAAAMDALDVLDNAFRIKTDPVISEFHFLSIKNSPVLSTQLASMPFDPPSRTWINRVIEDLHYQLKDRRLVDPKRLESA